MIITITTTPVVPARPLLCGMYSWLVIFFVRLDVSLRQALLEVVDSGAKNMEIAIVRTGKPNEVRPLFVLFT